MQITRKRRFFYGYWIAIACFGVTFVHSGSGMYAFSLFIKSLQTDLGWSRGDIMGAFTIFYLLLGTASPLVGRLTDRYGAKAVLVGGAILAGSGFAFLSMTNSLWHFYLGYAVIGVGLGAVSYTPASAVVSNWFKRGRGLAVGIMSMGVGGGGLGLAPLVGGFLIPTFGWRSAYLALGGIIVAIVIPVTLFVIKTKPSEMGLQPAGAEIPEEHTENSTAHSGPEGLTLRMAMGTAAFWLIGLSYFASMFSQAGVMQNQTPLLTDMGVPATTTALVLGMVGFSSAAGKFLFGWVCDRIPAKYAWTMGQVLILAGITILRGLSPESPPALFLLYPILMGLGTGSWLPTMSILISGNFGLVTYGAVFGSVILMQSIGVAFGPLLAGHLYDTTQTYQWVFVIFMCLYAVSIPAILLVRRPHTQTVPIRQQATSSRQSG